MADTKKKRPRDISQRAKLVVDIATGKIEDRDEARSAKSPAPDQPESSGASKSRTRTSRQLGDREAG